MEFKPGKLYRLEKRVCFYPKPLVGTKEPPVLYKRGEIFLFISYSDDGGYFLTGKGIIIETASVFSFSAQKSEDFFKELMTI